MGQYIDIPRMDGNARFNTLQVALTESSSLTRYVVADDNGKVYYSTNGGGGGGGTVTNVSVATANGLAGSVANPTTTPAITLSTTVTGILKGNGTAISAATPGTDYITPTQGTASWALNAITASYALNATSASYALNTTSASYALNATSASYALNATSASYAVTSANILGGTANYIPLWNTNTTLSSSVIYQTGGNVGIGTTTPGDKLDVVGDIVLGSATERLSLRSGGIGFNRKTSDGAIYDSSRFAYQLNHTPSATNTSDYLAIQIYNGSGTQITPGALVINGVGNVGIGTTSPTATLTVSKAASNFMFDLDNATETEFKLRTYNSGSTGAGTAVFTQGLYYSTNENGAIKFHRGNGGTDGFLTFSTTATERVRIDANGNVGIGTTSPGEKLSVIGNVSASAYIKSGGTSTQFLKADGSVDNNTYITIASVGNGTLTMGVSGVGLSGTQTFTANQSGNSTFTVTSNATSANTVSTIIARDGSGNFNAGTMTGTASYATYAVTADTVDGIDSSRIVYGDNATKTTLTSNLDITSSTGPSGFFEAQPNYTTGSPSNTYYHTINHRHLNLSNHYAMQIAGQFFDVNDLNYRIINNGVTSSWYRIFHSGNLSSFIQGGNSFGTAATLGTNDAQNLNIETNGTTRMFIGSSGNVGIGTTSPTTLLDVNGITVSKLYGGSGSAPNYAQFDAFMPGTHPTYGNDYAYFGMHRSGFVSWQLGMISSSFVIARGGGASQFTLWTDRPFAIDGSNNVGIGTITPSTRLHTVGSTQSTAASGVARLGFADSSSVALFTNADPSYGTLFGTLSSGNGWIQQQRVDGTATAYDLILQPNGGNVGIGTTSPSQKLEVIGGEIKAGRVDSSSEGGQVSFGRASDNATGWYIDAYGSTSTPSLRFVDVSNSSVRMTIDDSGDVGIGTTSPTYKLEVYGSSDDLYIAAVGSAPSLNLLDANPSPTIAGTIGLATNTDNFIQNSVPGDLCITTRGLNNAAAYIMFGSGSTMTAYISGSGDMYIAGTLTQGSTRNIKENIVPISNALSIVTQIQGVTYNKKDGSATNEPGFIAEDMYSILPSLVSLDRAGDPQGIKYTNLTAYLLEAIKELKAEIDILKNKT